MCDHILALCPGGSIAIYILFLVRKFTRSKFCMVALSKLSFIFHTDNIILHCVQYYPLEVNRMKLLKNIFQLLCIAGALGMTSFCIYKYLDDGSLVSINSRRFHDTPDDVYPSISICLYRGLFVDTNNVNGSDIEKKMNGLTEFNETFFENITYEDMTTTLQIEALVYEPFQGKKIQIKCQNSKCFKIYGDGLLKCFTYDVKFNGEKKYKRMEIVIKKTKELMNVQAMIIYFHHPGQLFRNGLDSVLSGPYHKIARSIKFNIQSLSVIKNRENNKLGLHFGFSAKLRIWQVSACKMEPRSGIISYKKPSTHPPTSHLS